MPVGDMDATPFREMVEKRVAEGWTLEFIAECAGFINHRTRRRGKPLDENGKGDTSRLKRAVGISEYHSRDGRYNNRRQRKITYETALKVIRGCDCDPVDFDL